MEDILDKLQNEPIALVFIAVVAVLIAFLFMIPVFLNYIKSFNRPTIKPEDEEFEEPKETKTTPAVVPQITTPAPELKKQNFKFTIPALINYIRSFNLPTIKLEDRESQKPTEFEVKETEEKTEEVEIPEAEEVPKETKTAHSVASKITVPTSGFKKLNIKFGFKFRPGKYLFLVVISLILVGAAIFAFDFLLRPVRMMDSWQLKLEKGGQLAKLQAGGLSSWPEAKIYLLDVRSSDSYEKGHLIGAQNLPSYKAAEFYPIENIPVVVYSSEFSLSDARAVAAAINENGKSGRITYENPGKIFIVKDGFEGLRKSGFRIESAEKK